VVVSWIVVEGSGQGKGRRKWLTEVVDGSDWQRLTEVIDGSDRRKWLSVGLIVVEGSGQGKQSTEVVVGWIVKCFSPSCIFCTGTSIFHSLCFIQVHIKRF
jgi:hypothetical protein